MHNHYTKIIKQSALGLILSVYFQGILHASPLIPIGDSASIFFNASSSLLWQSNVFYDDTDETEDFLLINKPGVELNIGNSASNFDAVLSAAYEFQNFFDETKLDQDYLKLNAISSYKGSRLNLDASASFDEQQTTTGEQTLNQGPGFIQIDRTSARLNGEYNYSPKFSFESGVGYSNREFRNEESLADFRAVSIPLDIYYELTPKVDLSLGYQYNAEKVGGFSPVASTNTDNRSHNRENQFVNIGARGELFPKLSGFFKVGYRFLNPDSSDEINGSTVSKISRDSNETLGVDAEFTYLTTPKLTTQLRLFRGFDAGSEAQSLETTSAKLNFKYAISGNYAANAFFNYTHRDFKDGNAGNDFLYRSGFSFSYVPNEYWRFSSGYTYSENSSGRTGQGFVNNIVSLSAVLRY